MDDIYIIVFLLILYILWLFIGDILHKRKIAKEASFYCAALEKQIAVSKMLAELEARIQLLYIIQKDIK
jgi:hypothetical protein